MDILNKLNEILKDYNGTNVKLNDDVTFDSLGFDSLDKVELLMKIEQEFDIEFGEDLKIDTIGQLVDTIKALIA